MGRVCAVLKCSSGHKADREERKLLGLRQPSLFFVPKAPEMLNKWKEALGLNLTTKDVICEQHFSPSSILKEYINIIDGYKHCMPRSNYNLVRGAVPMIVENTDITASTYIEATEEYNYIMQQQCVSSEQFPLQERIQADTQVEENIMECQEALLELSKENQIEEVQENQFEEFQENQAEQIQENPSEQNETNKKKSEKSDIFFMCYLCDKEFLSKSFLKEHMLSHEDVRKTLSLKKTPEKVVAEECTINDIEDYFEKIPLRQTWCWIKKLHCIVLIQIDSHTLQIRCLLKIHNDLLVTIHTYDDKVTVNLCTLESTTKIEQMLNNVEYNTIVCSGIGIMNKSRANNCTGFMPRKERILKEPRCDECIRDRINLRRQSRTNLKVRYFETKNALKLKKRKVQRLQKKVVYLLMRCPLVKLSTSIVNL